MNADFVFVVAIAVLVLEASASGIKCPSSPAISHAGCQITISFKNACSEVQEEMSSRVDGQYNLWHDPHNNGTYTFDDITVNTTWYLHRLTGDGKYTDKMIFTFAQSAASCEVTACSESQVFSILDYGTNYCNLHDLYCADSSCRPFTQLSYTEKVGKCTDSTVSSCYQV